MKKTSKNPDSAADVGIVSRKQQRAAVDRQFKFHQRKIATDLQETGKYEIPIKRNTLSGGSGSLTGEHFDKLKRVIGNSFPSAR